MVQEMSKCDTIQQRGAKVVLTVLELAEASLKDMLQANVALTLAFSVSF